MKPVLVVASSAILACLALVLHASAQAQNTRAIDRTLACAAVFSAGIYEVRVEARAGAVRRGSSWEKHGEFSGGARQRSRLGDRGQSDARRDSDPSGACVRQLLVPDPRVGDAGVDEAMPGLARASAPLSPRPSGGSGRLARPDLRLPLVPPHPRPRACHPYGLRVALDAAWRQPGHDDAATRSARGRRHVQW
jgi:hypothetical protein